MKKIKSTIVIVDDDEGMRDIREDYIVLKARDREKSLETFWVAYE